MICGSRRVGSSECPPGLGPGSRESCRTAMQVSALRALAREASASRTAHAVPHFFAVEQCALWQRQRGWCILRLRSKRPGEGRMMHHIPERRRPWRSVLVLAVVVLAGSLIWLVKPGRAAASLSAQVPGAQSVLSATAPVPTQQDSAAPPAATPPTLPVVLANPQVACATTVIANAAPVPSGAQAVVVGIEQAKAEIAALEAARDTPRLRRAL